jgi:hypothetical protein
MTNVSKLVARKTAEREKVAPTVPAPTDNRTEEISNAVISLQTREQYAREINIKWQEAREKYLIIGRYLIQAKVTLDHGEYEDMIRRDLPFSVETAYHLRSVAEAVDTGRIKLPELPRSYSVAYQIVTLKDSELDRARQDGLVRPDVPRAAVIEFKKALRTPKQSRTSSEKQVRALVTEYQRLKKRLHDLESKLKANGIDPNDLPRDERAIDVIVEQVN